MPKITFEGFFDEKHVKKEDSGQALIWDHHGYEIEGDAREDSDDPGTTVRFWSWDEEREHKSIKRFIGKRVRITVEVVSILDQIVEAVENDTTHGLGFEIGDRVRFSCKRGNTVHALWNKRSQGIRVVGLDVTVSKSVKVNFFISGSGMSADWVRPDELEKLNILDKLAEI